MHTFANARTERSRWGTNPWLNPRSERSRWETNPWLNQRSERSRWGTNPWLNQRSERSRWGTNPWLRSWVIPTRSERSRWGTNPWLNSRNERSRWGTNPWLNPKSKKSQEQTSETTEKVNDDQKGKESDTKDRIEEVENPSKRSYLWLLNPDIMTYLKSQELKQKRGRSNFDDMWGLKINFPVLNTYQDKMKRMDENRQDLEHLSDHEEPGEIMTRSPEFKSNFRFQVNPNSVLRQILEHFRILQRSRMTKKFVEPQIQPMPISKGPGMNFWKSALQNDLSEMYDDKISVVRLKRNSLFRSLFHANEISKILRQLKINQ